MYGVSFCSTQSLHMLFLLVEFSTPPPLTIFKLVDHNIVIDLSSKPSILDLPPQYMVKSTFFFLIALCIFFLHDDYHSLCLYIYFVNQIINV